MQSEAADEWRREQETEKSKLFQQVFLYQTKFFCKMKRKG